MSSRVDLKRDDTKVRSSSYLEMVQQTVLVVSVQICIAQINNPVSNC